MQLVQRVTWEFARHKQLMHMFLLLLLLQQMLPIGQSQTEHVAVRQASTCSPGGVASHQLCTTPAPSYSAVCPWYSIPSEQSLANRQWFCQENVLLLQDTTESRVDSSHVPLPPTVQSHTTVTHTLLKVSCTAGLGF